MYNMLAHGKFEIQEPSTEFNFLTNDMIFALW